MRASFKKRSNGRLPGLIADLSLVSLVRLGQVGLQKKLTIGNLAARQRLCMSEIRDNAVMTAAPTTEQMVKGGLRSSLLAIFINLTLALVKCLTGVIGHSFALLADGIESFLDVISSSVVYWGLRLAIKPPDKDHPYGHGKADPIAAAVVGVAMILAAVGIAAESINLIRTPHKLPHAYTLWVLICVVPVKALLSRYVSGVSEKIESSALRGDAWHHLSDAITSGFAFVGISAALLTGNPTADDWAALCASPVILFGGWQQLRRPIAELLDTAPAPEIEERVRAVAEGCARRIWRGEVLCPQGGLPLLRRSACGGAG